MLIGTTQYISLIATNGTFYEEFRSVQIKSGLYVYVSINALLRKNVFLKPQWELDFICVGYVVL